MISSEGTPSTPGTKKTSYTTANGEGLTFDPEGLSIFDEIQMIMERKNEEEKKNTN